MGKKILIIDDNSAFLQKISAMFQRKGVVVEQKTTLFDIDKIYIDGFDVVFCDQELTADSMTGIDFLKKIKTLGFQGKLVLLSGFDLESKAKKEGIDYIEKTPSALGRLLEYI